MFKKLLTAAAAVGLAAFVLAVGPCSSSPPKAIPMGPALVSDDAQHHSVPVNIIRAASTQAESALGFTTSELAAVPHEDVFAASTQEHSAKTAQAKMTSATDRGKLHSVSAATQISANGIGKSERSHCVIVLGVGTGTFTLAQHRVTFKTATTAKDTAQATHTG